MGRYLTVEAFGILTSVNSLGMMFSTFLGVLPYLISKYVIHFKHDEELMTLFVQKIYWFTIYIMVFISILSVVFTSEITGYLNITDSLPVYLFVAYLFAGVLISIFLGVMQGLLMYIKVSVKNTLVALLKLLFGIAIVAGLGYSYNGALFASLLANIIVGFWVYLTVIKEIPLRRKISKNLPTGTYKEIVKYAFPVGLTWLAIGVLTNVDIVLVKHYTSSIEAGEYAVASIIAKIAVFLPGALLTILFPQVSQNNVDGKSSVNTVLTVLIFTLLLAGGFSIIIYFFPEFIIVKLFGVKYINAADELVIASFAMSLVAVISVIFNFLLAKNLFNYLYITFFIIFLTGLTVYMGTNEKSLDIIKVIFYGCLAILVSNTLLLFYYKRSA